MGSNLVAVGLFAPLLLLTIVPAQLAVPVEAGINPIPQMTMSFEKSGIMVSPSYFAPGSASVGGTLSIDKIPGERFLVTLYGKIDTGWAVSITPQQVAFQNNIKVQGFTVTVTAPAATPTSLAGDLRIEARGDSLSLNPSVVGHVAVAVAPFFKLFIESPNPYKEVTPGSRFHFVVDLRNAGNSMDSYDIFVENQQELAAAGWTVSFTTPVVTKVRSTDIKSVRLSVMAPQKSTLYKAEGTVINVRAISQNARDANMEVDMVYPFVVYERGTYIDLLATSVATVVLLAIVLPMAYIARRVRRWNRTRPRPSEDDSEDGYDEDEYDDDYEDGDGDDYDDDYDDEEPGDRDPGAGDPGAGK